MRVEKLEPARANSGRSLGPWRALKSNRWVSKRDLDGSFNQIRIADPRKALYFCV
jgi:hypothetical protein